MFSEVHALDSLLHFFPTTFPLDVFSVVFFVSRVPSFCAHSVRHHVSLFSKPFHLVPVKLECCISFFPPLTSSKTTCVSAVLEQHGDQLQSLSWKRDGSLLASSCKVITTCTTSQWPSPSPLMLKHNNVNGFGSIPPNNFIPAWTDCCSLSVWPLDAASGSHSVQWSPIAPYLCEWGSFNHNVNRGNAHKKGRGSHHTLE